MNLDREGLFLDIGFENADDVILTTYCYVEELGGTEDMYR